MLIKLILIQYGVLFNFILNMMIKYLFKIINLIIHYINY